MCCWSANNWNASLNMSEHARVREKGGIMNPEEQERLLASAKTELAAAKRRVVHLQQIVDGLTGLLYPNAADITASGAMQLDVPLPNLRSMSDDPTNIKPREAVLGILRMRPGLPMTPRGIYSTLQKRGLVNPELGSGQAAYDQALRRLADEPDSPVEREEGGTYVYRPNGTRTYRFRPDGSGEVVEPRQQRDIVGSAQPAQDLMEALRELSEEGAKPGETARQVAVRREAARRALRSRDNDTDGDTQ